MSSKANWRAALLVLCCAVTPVRASTCAVIDPETNAIHATSEAPPNCSQLQVLTSTEFSMVQNPFGIEEADFSVVLWAFGSTLTLWAFGIGLGLVVSMLKKAR